MGCDIHGYWEVKTKDHGWVSVKPVNKSRSYTWFGIIANVRGTSDDWVDPPYRRGMPKDASDMWKEYTNFWNDLHSCTWLTPSEVEHAGNLYVKDCLAAGYHDANSQAIEVPLTEDDVIDQLYLGMNSEEEITLSWHVAVKDFRDKSEPLDKTVRMIIGFDN